MKFYCMDAKQKLSCKTFEECSKAGRCAMEPEGEIKISPAPVLETRKPRINKLDKRGASWRVLWWREGIPTTSLFWTWRKALGFALDLTSPRGVITFRGRTRG